MVRRGGSSSRLCGDAVTLSTLPAQPHAPAARTPMTSTSLRPLAGMRVLDFTRVLAGPFCTQILGDLGADVIKVERPGTGDDTRAWGPPWAEASASTDASEGADSCGTGTAASASASRESAYFLGVNRNKRSLTLDLKSPGGKDVVQRLVPQCDVVVENMVPGGMDGLGLGYDALSALNPGLVYCSISGYGPDGPYAKRPGYDVIVEAEAGLMSVTGEREGEPVKVGVAITDVTTGLFAHGAIMAALLARERNGGVGEHINCSLLESQGWLPTVVGWGVRRCCGWRWRRVPMAVGGHRYSRTGCVSVCGY